MVLEGVSLGRTRKKFKVVSIDGKGSNCARFDPKTTVVRLLPPGSEDFSAPDSAGKLFVENVPGLAPQVAELNEFLDRFEYSAGLVGEFRSCGIVVHGSHGTGKSLLLHRIADTRWGKVHKIKPTDKLTAIREAFKLARAQPSMILFDDFQKLVTQDRSNSSSVIAAIAEELGSLAEEARSTGVLPRVLVVATCLDFVNDMPWELQGHSAFYKNIVLPIPRVAGRLEILKYLDPAMKAEEYESCLADTAEKTHAYNGGDLKTLVYEAMDANRRRLKREGVDLRTIEQRYISPEDMKEALSKTTPTTMHDVNLSPPTIHWQDVGGQEGVKKTLSRMIKHTKVITLTLLSSSRLTPPQQNPTPSANKFMQRPPKGLILYGPPGCSKTLSAQAMATESGFNFFAVKGAELLNMYVGESERAVRALFARARAASPSIIFFDEIDSISGQRSGSATASKASVSSVNMLTTLLTEMDGFEALQGVLVLAATNRPEAMDSALLRPGRFDRVLYVGPPDREAREAVFKVHLKGLTVGELDYGELAVKSEGHSGAEIQSICANAGEVVQERADEDEEGKRHEIGQADLLQALEREPRQITQQMLDGYERWSNRFKKTM